MFGGDYGNKCVLTEKQISRIHIMYLAAAETPASSMLSLR